MRTLTWLLARIQRVLAAAAIAPVNVSGCALQLHPGFETYAATTGPAAFRLLNYLLPDRRRQKALHSFPTCPMNVGRDRLLAALVQGRTDLCTDTDTVDSRRAALRVDCIQYSTVGFLDSVAVQTTH